jgi:hypothetical protein
MARPGRAMETKDQQYLQRIFKSLIYHAIKSEKDSRQKKEVAEKEVAK